MFVDDEIAFSSPVAFWVSPDAVSRATGDQTEIGQSDVFALVVLLQCAMAFYDLVRRRALVRL